MLLNRFHHLSIRTRLTLLIVLVSVVSISVVGIISFYRTKQILTRDATERLALHSQLQSALFEKELQRIKSTEQGIEAILCSHLLQYDHLDSLNIQSFKEGIIPEVLQLGKLTGALSMWIVFNPQYIKGAHTISFIDNDSDGKYQREQEYDISKVDLNSDQYLWWKDAIQDGETWTKPYYWKAWDKSLITYSKAVYVDNKLVACVGSDFDFSSLQATWSSIRIFKTGYIVLTDQHYNTIVHPSGTIKNAKDLMNSKTYELFSRITKTSKQGVMPNTGIYENRMLAFNHLSNGWIMMASAPVDEILLPLDNIRNTGLILVLIAVIIAIGLAHWLSKQHYAPILKLITLFNQSSRGTLSHRWEKSSIPEFDQLGEHFNQFMTQMQQLITRLSHQQRVLTHALKKSTESDELKSAFLGNLSHEIRTPLYAITGFAALLNTEDLSAEDRHNFTQIVQKNSDALLKFVDNIMIFSQLEQGQLTASMAEVSVNNVAEDVYHNFHGRYDSPHKQVVWHLAGLDANRIVKLDVGLYRIVAEVIIDNAWKFTHEGIINIGFETENHSFVFYVEDSGIGVPSAYHKEIFNKFFKYKDIDEKMLYAGVGMGLSIAKGITDLMKGRILVTSELGKGARFEVIFPLQNLE